MRTTLVRWGTTKSGKKPRPPRVRAAWAVGASRERRSSKDSSTEDPGRHRAWPGDLRRLRSVHLKGLVDFDALNFFRLGKKGTFEKFPMAIGARSAGRRRRCGARGKPMLSDGGAPRSRSISLFRHESCFYHWSTSSAPKKVRIWDY